MIITTENIIILIILISIIVSLILINTHSFFVSDSEDSEYDSDSN